MELWTVFHSSYSVFTQILLSRVLLPDAAVEPASSRATVAGWLAMSQIIANESKQNGFDPVRIAVEWDPKTQSLRNQPNNPKQASLNRVWRSKNLPVNIGNFICFSRSTSLTFVCWLLGNKGWSQKLLCWITVRTSVQNHFWFSIANSSWHFLNRVPHTILNIQPILICRNLLRSKSSTQVGSLYKYSIWLQISRYKDNTSSSKFQWSCSF